ncbi:MAG: glycosyltransferase family protein [Pirellulaceae bacterium]|nr:glycosyltransferase family protein [Pirellulaceae bacterium]
MPSIEKVLHQGWQLQQAGQVQQAEAVYRQVLQQAPDNPEAMVYLGIALFDQRRYDESAQAYRQALAIRDEFPIAWNNLGNSLRMCGQIDEAEACFERALEQDPRYLSAFKNRGTLWVWSGQIERGLKWYQDGLKIDPDNAELHRNLGVIELLLGNYDVGWPEYRWRWTMPGTYRPQCGAPLWQGESLEGKTILLYCEQGRGDAIQFIRMTKVLSDAGARVYLQCAPEMVPLFVSAKGITAFYRYDAIVPPVDYHASLIDAVDVWYGLHQELPYATEYVTGGYLTVSQALIDYWANWLDQHCPVQEGELRIGINWQGNRQHHADVYRSLPLKTFAPLADLPHVRLINLQFGDGVEQLEQVDFADSIVRLPSDTDGAGGAFTDTAAVLTHLDAVVTSDTALAHLAGAVGTKVWTLLGRVPDWRWLTEGDTTPWYPSMRLARQKEIGHWDDVIQCVTDELTQQ